MSLRAKKSDRSHEGKQEALKTVTQGEMKRLNLLVEKTKFIKFKQKATAEDLSMSEVVNQMIDVYLSK